LSNYVEHRYDTQNYLNETSTYSSDFNPQLQQTVNYNECPLKKIHNFSYERYEAEFAYTLSRCKETQGLPALFEVVESLGF